MFPGEIATANQPILTVMDLSRVIAKAHIPGAQAALIKVGNPAEIKIPNVDDPVKAKVTLVSPALDTGSTTIEVWVETAKPPVLVCARAGIAAVMKRARTRRKRREGAFDLLARAGITPRCAPAGSSERRFTSGGAPVKAGRRS